MRVKRDLLLHPIRLRIVQLLVNRPMTANQIKDQLTDVAQATLYRQLKALLDGGLLEVVDEQAVRGGLERTYGVVESATKLDYADVADAEPDEHFRLFATFIGTILNDYSSYLNNEGFDLQEDRVGYSQAPLWLTTEEFDEFASAIRHVVSERLQNQPTPERRRYLLNTIVMPETN